MHAPSSLVAVNRRGWIAIFWRIGLAGLAFAVLWGVIGCRAHADDGPAAVVVPPVRVLVDAYHAHTWIETLPRPGLTDYHLLHGPARAVAALTAMGYQCDVQIEPWSDAALNQTELVVINLVSADRPPFLVEEIEALMRFLRRGGGAVIVTDHTNCYFHNHVLGAWFHELDLELHHDLACERPPLTLSDGNAWLNIESLSDHPVVRGLRNVGLLSGGTVDERFGIAWTSPQSWADDARIPAFGEGASPGFFGDYRQQPAERRGPLAVVAAKPIGQGRVVVIADQNCIGGIFLNYADNRRLWLQSCVWAAGGEEALSDTSKIDRGMAGESERSQVWCLEPLSEHRYRWSELANDGFFHAFAMLNKHADARATDRAMMDAGWMIVPETELITRDAWRRLVLEFLAQPDRHVLVLGHETDAATMETWSQAAGLIAVDEALPNGIRKRYRSTSGSQLHWSDARDAWSNKAMPDPGVASAEEEERSDAGVLQWMHALGFRRVPSVSDAVLWPED
jgi:hypothetical protein